MTSLLMSFCKWDLPEGKCWSAIHLCRPLLFLSFRTLPRVFHLQIAQQAVVRSNDKMRLGWPKRSSIVTHTETSDFPFALTHDPDQFLLPLTSLYYNTTRMKLVVWSAQVTEIWWNVQELKTNLVLEAKTVLWNNQHYLHLSTCLFYLCHFQAAT